jgi:hypothetical protein
MKGGNKMKKLVIGTMLLVLVILIPISTVTGAEIRIKKLLMVVQIIPNVGFVAPPFTGGEIRTLSSVNTETLHFRAKVKATL